MKSSKISIKIYAKPATVPPRAKLVEVSTAKVSVLWPSLAYIILTLGEVLLYGTMLELAYTAAPKSMKGFVTALWLVTVGLANLQARLLELTLDENADLDAELANLGRAWRNGDAGGLEKLLLRDYREFPDLYESIVYRRNRAWVPQVEALLQGEEDVLVVVGALHLVGERGLIELLRRRGVRAERYRLH